MVSKEIQKKIDEYKKLMESLEHGSDSIREHNQKVEQQLKEAEAELKEAIEMLGDNPTEENRKKEVEARRKVATLKLEHSGARERETVVFSSKTSKGAALKEEILKLAGKELLSNYQTKKPEVLQKIEDAKKAYLLSLKELHDLTVEETQVAYYDIAREIDAQSIAKQFEPGVSMYRPLITWRDPGYNYYGIKDLEINRAFNRGIIEKGSIRE